MFYFKEERSQKSDLQLMHESIIIVYLTEICAEVSGKYKTRTMTLYMILMKHKD